MTEPVILAGDIGGTNTRLCLYQVRDAEVVELRGQSYASQSVKSLDEIVRRFMSEGPPVRIGVAALAVAGPVVDGRCVATNLPWVLEEAILAEAAKVAHLRLLNDLQALAFGVLFLPKHQLVSLNGLGPPGRGAAAVIAVGTGLGQAYLHWDGARYHPAPSEGSHGEFGPQNEVQLELSRYLIHRFGHPSTERVISGPGFSLIYDFLVQSGREKAPPELENELKTGDRNAIISAHGVKGRYDICARVMDIFVDCFGAEAGNVALRGFATGGLYIGGGVVPKILPRLQDGRFVRAFESKGRFRDFLSRIALSVVTQEGTGLLGSAHYARLML